MNVNANSRLPLILTSVALVVGVFFSGCATVPKPAKAGNIYHIGLVWLKEPGNVEHRQKIATAAHAFAREVKP